MSDNFSNSYSEYEVKMNAVVSEIFDNDNSGLLKSMMDEVMPQVSLLTSHIFHGNFEGWLKLTCKINESLSQLWDMSAMQPLLKERKHWEQERESMETHFNSLRQDLLKAMKSSDASVTLTDKPSYSVSYSDYVDRKDTKTMDLVKPDFTTKWNELVEKVLCHTRKLHEHIILNNYEEWKILIHEANTTEISLWADDNDVKTFETEGLHWYNENESMETHFNNIRQEVLTRLAGQGYSLDDLVKQINLSEMMDV